MKAKIIISCQNKFNNIMFKYFWKTYNAIGITINCFMLHCSRSITD